MLKILQDAIHLFQILITLLLSKRLPTVSFNHYFAFQPFSFHYSFQDGIVSVSAELGRLNQDGLFQ